jgi:tight adherence protein C
MLLLIAMLIGIAVAGGVLLVAQVLPARSPAVQRLAQMGVATGAEGIVHRRHRQERSTRLNAILENLGSKVEGRFGRPDLRQFLIQAGYTAPTAVPLYLGARLALAVLLASVVVFLLPLAGAPASLTTLAALWGVAMGWTVPAFIVGGKVKRRQLEMTKALPDALDLLVVCVEAGLGLNQAMVRVADEMGNVSPVLAEQFALVNLEIRAGTPRDEALRNMGERTGVEDIRAFAGMLIQTDKFGTSIATALRIHSDVLRTKRRQRAEEAAAKTAIKMLFPLVFFIFPAMFVVILGPAMIQIVEALSAIR